MKCFVVDYNDDDKNLITYLTSKFPNLNVNAVYKALRKKDIKINNKRISENVKLSYGDEILVYITDEILFGENKKIDIPITYEDENIVIFNKPANIEVEGNNSIEEIMKEKYSFLKPCHRIDRNTIGLVVFAKNENALHIIENLFKEKNIEKHYIACCYGIPKFNEKTEYAYLFKDSKKSLVYITNDPKKGASKIQTSYKVISKNIEKKLSLLDITLHTGKTHQIRAHLAFLGLPILGDGKYGSYEINKKFGVKYQALCSYTITFHISDNNILSYLNNVEIKLKKIPFTNFMK